jgi:hypothetical protein
MKEVVKKDLPEISGGEYWPDGCIPYPILPGTDGDGLGRDRLNPIDDPSVPPDA